MRRTNLGEREGLIRESLRSPFSIRRRASLLIGRPASVSSRASRGRLLPRSSRMTRSRFAKTTLGADPSCCLPDESHPYASFGIKIIPQDHSHRVSALLFGAPMATSRHGGDRKWRWKKAARLDDTAGMSLTTWRCPWRRCSVARQEGQAHVAFGSVGAVRYRREDVDAWLNSGPVAQNSHASQQQLGP